MPGSFIICVGEIWQRFCEVGSLIPIWRVWNLRSREGQWLTQGHRVRVGTSSAPDSAVSTLALTALSFPEPTLIPRWVQDGRERFRSGGCLVGAWRHPSPILHTAVANIRHSVWNQMALGSNSGIATSLGKWPHLSEPQFPHLKNGDDQSTYLMGLLWELNTVNTKCVSTQFRTCWGELLNGARIAPRHQ